MGSNLSTRTKRNNIIEFEDKYIDQGSIRYCFRGKITKGPDRGGMAVVKVFKDPPLRSGYIDVRNEFKVYSIANDYARMFSRLLSENGWQKTVSFPEPDLVRIDGLSFWTWLTSNYFKSGDYICAEKYLKGEYIKFTKVGYTTRNETMECFQHYTFVKYGYRTVVCDLQGVITHDKYLLTDPAVNSLDRRFGNTDCGKKGMIEVLGRHKFNRICRDIGLEDNSNYDARLRVVYNSTSKRMSHTNGI